MYKVTLGESALKSLKKFPKDKRSLIFQKISQLENFPQVANMKSLQHPLEGYRLRVGNYRVLFIADKDKKKIEIYIISHRSEAY